MNGLRLGEEGSSNGVHKGREDEEEGRKGRGSARGGTRTWGLGTGWDLKGISMGSQ